MSGTNTGRAPRTDSEWAREIVRRIRLLESKDTVRAGDWVLSTRDDGHLIATRPTSDVTIIDSVATLTELDLTQLKGEDGQDGSPGGGGTASPPMFARMYRSSGQIQVPTRNPAAPLPTDTFTVLDPANTSNMAGYVDLQGGSFTAPEKATYFFAVGLKTFGAVGSNRMHASIHKALAASPTAFTCVAEQGETTSSQGFHMGVAAILLLEAGDVVKAGMFSLAQMAVDGNGEGSYSWFSMARVSGSQGATGPAGPTQDITGKVNGFPSGVAGPLNLWTGTQAAYNALGTWPNTTVYVITSATATQQPGGVDGN